MPTEGRVQLDGVGRGVAIVAGAMVSTVVLVLGYVLASMKWGSGLLGSGKPGFWEPAFWLSGQGGGIANEAARQVVERLKVAGFEDVVRVDSSARPATPQETARIKAAFSILGRDSDLVLRTLTTTGHGFRLDGLATDVVLAVVGAAAGVLLLALGDAEGAPTGRGPEDVISSLAGAILALERPSAGDGGAAPARVEPVRWPSG